MSFSGCAVFTDEYGQNQKKILAYLLEDLPLPDDAKIIREPTELLVRGESVSGRISLTSGYSPAENLMFFNDEAVRAGWKLMSSKVSDQITLVYSKSGRFATVYIEPRSSFSGFIVGDKASTIDISIVHPDNVPIRSNDSINLEDL